MAADDNASAQRRKTGVVAASTVIQGYDFVPAIGSGTVSARRVRAGSVCRDFRLAYHLAPARAFDPDPGLELLRSAGDRLSLIHI